VLVTGAALFIRSLGALLSVDAGFDRRNLAVVRVEPSRDGAPGSDFYRTLRDRIAGIPGVASVSLSKQPPIHDGSWTQHVGLDDAAPDDAGPQVYFNAVSPGYFDTMKMRLVAGRDFRWTDEGSMPPVVAVSQTLARTFFGDANPIGRHLTMGRNANQRVMEIVAVIADAKYGYLQAPDRPVAYLPYLQAPGGGDLTAVVRTNVPLASVSGPLRQAVRTLEPESPIAIETVDARVRDSVVRERLLAVVAAALGQFALLLGCGALYGLMSHVVARRTNEIGVRIALGAERRTVIWMVMRDALRLAAIGTAIGLVLVLWFGRTAEGLLFSIKPTDPASLTAAVVALMAVAAMAGYIPARRAAHADPVAALRAD
jgi:predicted permease